ncbi:hypothetical protein ACKWTF_007677 [Chironomus riparius]
MKVLIFAICLMLVSLILAAPAPYDETVAETVGSNDVANNEGDVKQFLLLKLGLLGLLFG